VVDWQVTATTLYCDAVDDDVTIIVNRDWTTKCSGYSKYSEKLDNDTAKVLKSKSKILGRKLKCEGPLDFRVTDFRDKLADEQKSIQ
jgi:hypothetical protein